MINFSEDKIDLNHIYNVNCIDFIDKMIDKKIVVDAIITDPPYNISRKNNFETIGRKGIDFGEWDKDFDQIKWLTKIDLILKDGGSLIIFNDWKNMGLIAKFLETKGFEIKDLIRWVKTNPMPRNTNRRYVADFELALWVVKKGKWTFNKDENKPYLKPEYFGSPPAGKNRIHPTQKSKEVISELIKTHTNEGDIIFDPFSGSGEISHSAFKLNRKYLGCEINESYYSESINRFKKEVISPAFNHIGNKRRIIDEIISNFSDVKISDFVDVFAGSGVVSANFKNANKYFLNDNDQSVTKLLEYLFNTKPNILLKEVLEVIDFYKLPTVSFYDYKSNYKKLRDDYNFKPINNFKKTSMLFVLVLFGFNQQIRLNNNKEFNIPTGKFYFNKYQQEKVVKFVSSIEKAKFKISNDEFDIFVKNSLKEIDKKNSLFYFDPPYLITNGTYNDCWTEKEEERLLKVLENLSSLKVKWVLSNQLYSNRKTNSLLLDFLMKNKNLNITKIDISYRNSSYHRKNYDRDLEIVIRNF